jgi:hypothetical protein
MSISALPQHSTVALETQQRQALGALHFTTFVKKPPFWLSRIRAPTGAARLAWRERVTVFVPA